MARVAGRALDRNQVAEAAWRVILRDGLHRTSIRAIARELGATTGVVTYYFRDKAELMLFALDRLSAAILRDLEAALTGRVGFDRLRRALETTLPVGTREATGWRIWVAFVGMAASNRRLRDQHQRRLEILSDLLTRELAALQAVGAIVPTLDPRFEADALIALCDGIGLGYLLRPKSYPPDRQRAIVDEYLAARFGAPRSARASSPRGGPLSSGAG